MAIQKSILKFTCIVPVRFDRAPDANDPSIDNSSPDANAPDPDDRSFIPGQRNLVPDRHLCPILPVGIDTAVAQEARPETRVRLIREDMDNSGALFVTGSSDTHLELTTPAPDTQLPNSEKMMIKFKVKSAGKCFLEVRFGAKNGPIIHRLCLWINEVADVNTSVHVPRIRGTAINDSSGNPVPERSNRTDAQTQTLMNNTNKIYFPYGLRFKLIGGIDRAAPTLNFTNRGMVNDQTNEFNTIMAHNRVNNSINIHFVPQIGAANEVDQVGGSASSARRNPNTYGYLISDITNDAQTVAHELGHILNLVNDPKPNPKFIHINARADNRFPGTGKCVRDDMISRRRLMWAFMNNPNRSLRNFTPFRPDPVNKPNDWRYDWENIMPYRATVGYGNRKVGAMLAIKQLEHDRTDLEMQEMQKAAARI